ncbi:MAG: DUF2073 domain-containing protein [Nanoarchaeota archaeon]|nr:DUF2073 domain-containing protein [Nanoarchaeota archaeon]
MQVLSYELMKGVGPHLRIKKIMEIVKKGDIVMLEGRLSPDEETILISSALENVSGKFSGIEIAFLDSMKSKSTFEKLRDSLIKVLAKDRFGITVIGPSKIIKEIKMNPDKLEILFK